MQAVVVGLDGPKSEDPLQWAAEYCRLRNDALVGVVAYRPSQSEIPPDWYEEDLARVRKQAEAALDAAAPGVPHRLETRYGDPRTVITETADEEPAGVVVVGARGSGGFRGLGLGSVAHHLSHHLSTPLVVVPAMGGPLRGSPVVVGVDGSPGDVVTLEWAAHLARAARGPLRAVYASDPVAMSYPHPRGATIADQMEMTVRDQISAMASSGVDIALEVDVAHPVPALTRVAERENASVVVVGRKGVGHLRGLSVGRVPAQLPFHAHRPVAIVPRHASE